MMAARTQAADAAAAVASPATGTQMMCDGKPPYPATMRQPVSQLQGGQPRPGLTLEAAVDPSNPAAIWLDLPCIR